MIMKLRIISVVSLFIGVAIPKFALAHCPLCTAGAGALAILAASLGVPGLVVATLIGGFALAMGLWMARIAKKKYFPWQDQVIAGVVYLLTIVPLWPVLVDYKALYIPALGIDKYAETIPVNIYLVGSILGGLILFGSPYLSKWISKTAGKQLFPYQGIVITLVLLGLLPLLVDKLLLT